MEHDVAVLLCVVRKRELHAQGFHEPALPRIRLHQLQALQRETAQQCCGHAAHQSGTDDGDPVTEAGPGLPEGVEGDLGDAGEHSAACRHAVGNSGE